MSVCAIFLFVQFPNVHGVIKSQYLQLETTGRRREGAASPHNTRRPVTAVTCRQLGTLLTTVFLSVRPVRCCGTDVI